MIQGIVASSVIVVNPLSLLLHMDGANGSTNFIDSSPNPKTVTVYGASQMRTDQIKFGTSSGYFDGDGDYLRSSLNSAFGFGIADFTIEMFIRFEENRTDYFFSLGGGEVGGDLVLARSGSNSSLLFAGLSASNHAGFITNTWHHVAFSRSSQQSRFFLDGNLVAQAEDLMNYGSSRTVIVGGIRSGIVGDSFFLKGWIDELRILKGVGLYTANFTPPTAPFPDA